MSVPSWQKRCGEVNGYDHEASTVCHAKTRDLEYEFDLVEGYVSDWLYESAAYSACFARQSMLTFNHRVTVRRSKPPANDNGRSS